MLAIFWCKLEVSVIIIVGAVLKIVEACIFQNRDGSRPVFEMSWYVRSDVFCMWILIFVKIG